MFSKSFVSIYFLPERILLLQLSPNKKKVKKYGQVLLPKGLIKDYQVVDKDSLATTLSAAWSKLRIKEKIVGIVIPEFSTFTKYFKLPNLALSEIDEAVRWQAQEYLPNGLEDTTLDWKVTRKDASGIEVMTISVDKNILTDYIEVAENAGLFPMKVETPSVCLLRFAQKGKGGVFTIYSNFGETILVLSEGEKIVGTSIQHTDDFGYILRSGAKMLNHFSDIKVAKVMVGGEGVGANLDKITSTLNTKVELINPGLSDFDANEAQKNLIPISMQFEDAEQPSDPTTLNLLPNDLVDKYKTQKLKNQIWGLTLTITLFVWISFFMTLAAYLFMNQNLNNLKAAVSQKESLTGVANPLDEIESINTISKNVLKIKGTTVLPQVILNEIYSAKTTGLSIEKYSLDLDKGQVNLQGFAPDRLSLIQFKENLEKIKEFDKVEIPISSFEAETNLEFSLSFLYKPISDNVKEKPKVDTTNINNKVSF